MRSDREGRLRRLARSIGASSVVRAGTAAGVIRGAGLVAAFFVQILLARIVADPAQFGVYAWGQNLVFLLGGLFALGIPLASSRLAAVHARRGDLGSMAAVRRSGLRWVALSSLTGAALAILATSLVPAGAFDELPRSIALTAIAASPLVSFTLFHQALARARSQLAAAFLPTQLLRPLFTGLLATAWFVWTQRAPAAIELLLAVGASLALVLLVQLLLDHDHSGPAVDARSERSSAASEPEPDYAADRIMANALPMFATRLSDLVIQYGSIFVLGVLGGPMAAAGFFVAQRLAQLAVVPRSVITSVVQPWLASAHADGERSHLQRVLTHAGHATLWPTLAAVAALALLGPLLLGLFGAEYRSAYDILLLLLAAHFLGAALGPAQQVLMMSGQQRALMRLMSLAAGFHLFALVAFIPWLGAVGAAGAVLASTLVARLGCLRLVRSRLELDPSVLHVLRRRHSGEVSRRDQD